jgi:subtilisin family serine protease
MKLRPVSLAVLVMLSSLAFNAAAQQPVRRSYIVQLADKPAASYTGGVKGMVATKPAAGQLLNVNGSDVQAYLGYLAQKQADVLTQIAGAPVTHDYKVVFNGFAALLTDAEVRKLKAHPGVAAVDADVAYRPDTNYTPQFLGLDKPDGLWNRLRGGKAVAGEGIIIGMVDSGIWPENKAFADRVDANGKPTFDPAGTVAYDAPPAAWAGACQTGEGFGPGHCNRKLIGARYFNQGFLNSGLTLHWTDFVSPRDSVGGPTGHGGHGTHTSSTAGGNGGVAANVDGVPMGEVSGMAPRARIAMYKVCWTYDSPDAADGTGSANSCFSSDSVAAIERAVLDGVNVINYSISGSQTSVTEPVEIAFFGAANANVFVAASAGNSGPANAVAHLSPWVTTVAAATHNRLLGADARTGAGATYTGASMNVTALPATAAIAARDAGLAPFASLDAADKDARRLCFSAGDRDAYGGSPAAALDATLVAGKVVVCERGVNARVAKSALVAQLGGAGMVLVDTAAGMLAEIHSVPTVHVTLADGSAIRTYVQGAANPTLSLSAFSTRTSSVPAPQIASFSSRGPNRGYPSVLKPDLAAPGVDIIAGVTPALSAAERDQVANGELVPAAAWNLYSGTSMSSPHVAGLAAVLRQQHPGWSPAAIKSALMTTGATTFDDGVPGAGNGRLPWAQGAGHVVPNLATDPGLVYDAGIADYTAFLCGTNTIASKACLAYGSIASYNLNLASLTAGSVTGKLAINRSVTNVGPATATYTASASLPGFDVAVTPPSLTLAPGAKGSFSVSLTRTSAALNAYSFGAVEWRDGNGHIVRSPLTARPVALSGPSELYSEQVNGNVVYTLGSGFTGKLVAVKAGMKAAQLDVQTVARTAAADGGIAECQAGGSDGVRATSIVVPPGTLMARFTLHDADTSGFKAGQFDDLDLMLLDDANVLVGLSGSATSNEKITLFNPRAGTYRVCVAGFAPWQGVATYTLNSWVMGPGDSAGSFKVSVPGNVFVGGTNSAAANWSGLVAGQRYLAIAQYLMNGTTVVGQTMFEVDATDPVPVATTARAPSVRAVAE